MAWKVLSAEAQRRYCSNFNNGFVPAATLGITSTVDNQGNTGFAVDSWGNRIRYAVTSSNGYAFTETNGMSTVGMSSLSTKFDSVFGSKHQWFRLFCRQTPRSLPARACLR